MSWRRWWRACGRRPQLNMTWQYLMILQIWWRTSTRRPRTKPTDVHKIPPPLPPPNPLPSPCPPPPVCVYMDWMDCNEASKPNRFPCFNSSYQDISNTIPTNQRLFYIFSMARCCPCQTGLCTRRQPPLSLGQWLSIYTHLSVVVRITVVIKASLKNFFCFVLVYETK